MKYTRSERDEFTVAAIEVMKVIWEDIIGRRGFKQLIEYDIAEDTRENVRLTWIYLIRQKLQELEEEPNDPDFGRGVKGAF